MHNSYFAENIESSFLNEIKSLRKISTASNKRIGRRNAIFWSFYLRDKRWIVECSLAWINNSRRLSKDYEISVCSAQTVCTIAAFRTLHAVEKILAYWYSF